MSLRHYIDFLSGDRNKFDRSAEGISWLQATDSEVVRKLERWIWTRRDEHILGLHGLCIAVPTDIEQSTIKEAKHYVYIENQYFISSVDRSVPQNRIAEALFDRYLCRALHGLIFH